MNNNRVIAKAKKAVPKKVAKKVAKKAKTRYKNPLIWSQVHEKLHRRLFNHLERLYPEVNRNLETYIDLEKRTLGRVIGDELNLGLSSRKELYFMVARWLAINKPDNRYIKIYQEKGYVVSKDIQAQESHNKQTEQEQVNYRPLEYFEQILDELNNEHEEPSDAHLILAMAVYQPTMRPSFYESAKIITRKANNNGVDNYIRFDRRTRKIYYIVNHDKVSKDKTYQGLKHSEIEVEHLGLKNMMWQSFDRNSERVFFFQKPGEENHYNYSTFRTWIRRLTGLPELTFNMLRSAHVNHVYKNPRSTLRDKQKLALQLRHSVDAGMLYYEKIFEEEDIDEDIEEMEKKQLRQELQFSRDRLKDKQTDKIRDQQYRKRRADVVRNLNKKSIKPLKSSVDKYELEYDEDTGLWR